MKSQDDMADLREKVQEIARDPVKRTLAEIFTEGRAFLWGPKEMVAALEKVWALCVKLGDLNRAKEVVRLMDSVPEAPETELQETLSLKAPS